MKLKRKTQAEAPVTEAKKTTNAAVPLPDIGYCITDLDRPDVTPRSYPGKIKQDRRTRSQEYVITLDPGSFRYVWEMLEARAHSDYRKFSAIEHIELACRESVNAFRRSYAYVNSIEAPKPKKLVVKKKSK